MPPALRSILAEEAARGRPNTAEERQKRIAELERTLRGLNTSTDPVRQEARRLIVQGNVAGGRAMLEAPWRPMRRRSPRRSEPESWTGRRSVAGRRRAARTTSACSRAALRWSNR